FERRIQFPRLAIQCVLEDLEFRLGLRLYQGQLGGLDTLVGSRLGRWLRATEYAGLGLLRSDATGDGLSSFPDVVARDGVPHGPRQFFAEVAHLAKSAAEDGTQRLHREVAAEGSGYVLTQGLRQIADVG